MKEHEIEQPIAEFTKDQLALRRVIPQALIEAFFVECWATEKYSGKRMAEVFCDFATKTDPSDRFATIALLDDDEFREFLYLPRETGEPSWPPTTPPFGVEKPSTTCTREPSVTYAKR